MATLIQAQRILDDRYRLDERIASGGMATVYRAWDTQLHRDVAVKMLAPARAADPTYVERFKREARAAAGLSHPNIVAVYNWGTCNDADFIVMEYIPGQTLKAYLGARGPLPEAEALAITDQIADALDAAHRQGIVHRDIKPHNVLMAPDGRAKVTDFGIAHTDGATHLTTASTVLGTAQYLSPEQVLHQPVDGRSDLYSLGIVLYEMLIGRPPFLGDSVATVALQHAYVAPPSPRTRRPDLSRETEAVVLTALAKEPAARYQTAVAFRDALEVARTRLADDHGATMPLPTVAPPGVPVAPPLPQRRQPQRRWLLALPLLACALALLVGRGAFRSSGDAFADLRLTAETGTPATPATRVPSPSAPALVAAPEPPRATPVPTVSAAPTAAPPTPTAVLPSPTRRVIVQAPRPQEAVLGFYYLVTRHEFDTAAALWTSRLQAASPPAQQINARYGETDRITVQRWEVTAQGADRATVAIVVDEFKQGATTSARYQGTWSLVHTESGWLLDEQHMEPA